MEQGNRTIGTLTNNNKIKTFILRYLPIILIIGLSLFIRIYLPWGVSVRDGFIRIAADDAPYHLRLIENTVHNFPARIYFDPFVFYKDYFISYVSPLFTWMGSSFAFLLQLLFFGGGVPTRYTIEMAASLLPAFAGSLVVLLCYLTANLLFENRKVAFVSALILATMPGQFLSRTIFGFADHHCFEILFSLMAFYFLIKALKEIDVFDKSNDSQANYHIRLAITYSLLGGFSLVLYVLSWIGAAFLLPILLLFWFLAFIIRHLQGKLTFPLFISSILYILPLLITSIFLTKITGLEDFFRGTITLPLLASLVIILLLQFLARFLNQLKLKKSTYPLILFLLFSLGWLVTSLTPLKLLLEGPLSSMIQLFFPSGQLATVSEAQPMFIINGIFSLDSAWSNFTTNLFFAFLSLIILSVLAFKWKNNQLIFLIIWSWYMLFATSSQNRFAYYLAINVALLSGYLGVMLIQGLLQRLKNTLETGGLILGTFNSTRTIKLLFYIWLLVALVYPNLLLTSYSASRGLGTHPDWYDSLKWLSENTPTPGLDYYDIYKVPQNQEDYAYPVGSYSVMSWWDFGYLISYYGKRIPVANPGGFGVGSISEVTFIDTNLDQIFQKEEPLIIDLDQNGFYNEPDLVLSGEKPSQNPRLSEFNTDYLYYDFNQDKKFNPQEPLIRDKDKNFIYSSKDELLYGGLIPPQGSKLRFISVNPGAAPFFATIDVNTAQDILKYFNTKYIITSLSMATNKFWAMAELGAGGRSKFIGDFLMETVTEAGVEIKTVRIYYPEFYKTMIARLHFFKGEEVTPDNSTWVIAYEIKDEGKSIYKIITNEWLFKTYDEAVEFIKRQENTNYLIVGKSPNVSPVPLEKLDEFKAVYETINTVLRFRHEDRKLRGIIIFEYLGIK